MLNESFKPSSDISSCLSETCIQDGLIGRNQLNSDGNIGDCDTVSYQVLFAALKLGVEGHNKVLYALQGIVKDHGVDCCMTMSSTDQWI